MKVCCDLWVKTISKCSVAFYFRQRTCEGWKDAEVYESPVVLPHVVLTVHLFDIRTLVKQPVIT